MKSGQQKQQRPGGGGGQKRRPGGSRKPHLKGPNKGQTAANKGKPAGGNPGAAAKQAGVKRKAAEPVALGGASGDADDFGHLLDDMEDYRPAAGEEGGQSDVEPPADSEQQQQQGEGSGDVAAAGEGGKKAKKRRKKGQKLSAMEFEASRNMARQIAECTAEEQADWLWASYQQTAAASTLERGSLSAEGFAPLPAQGGLESRLKALGPAGGWQKAFCSREGPAGSPTTLLVSPSAIGAVGLVKLLPGFNKACKVAKLFAKHVKVEEQEEVLRTQVVCIGAGTPNRLCKLADSGALKLDRLAHVVVDVQLDAKQRDILAIPETKADWWQLFERHLKARLDAGSLKLSLINSDRLRE